jgi:hypothetical protein
MLPQDKYDIQEYVLTNIETYFENYVNYGSYLSFSDYIFTRVSTQLMHKYHRFDIKQAFDDPRMVAIIEFYNNENDKELDEDN